MVGDNVGDMVGDSVGTKEGVMVLHCMNKKICEMTNSSLSLYEM